MANQRILDNVLGVVDFEALTKLLESRDRFIRTPLVRAQGEIAGELVCRLEEDGQEAVSALTAIIMARFAIADLVTCMGAEKARQITENFIEAERCPANPVRPVQAATLPSG